MLARKIAVALMLLCASLAESRGQADSTRGYVYRVRIPATNQHKAISQTGFRLRGTKGIITALHGVADGVEFSAMNETGDVLNGLTIGYVDIENDLALLRSKELENREADGLSPAEGTGLPDSGAALRVLGHPLGIDLYNKSVTAGVPVLKRLAELIPPALSMLFNERKSPSYNIQVLNIEGNLVPGHSGAPVLNSDNRVIGVVNGGLQGGSAGISWAIPLQSAKWVESSKEKGRLTELANSKFTALFETEDDSTSFIDKRSAVARFQNFNVSAAAPIRNVGWAIAIAPDGRWLAYVTGPVGRQRLWIRQFAAPAPLQLDPPASYPVTKGESVTSQFTDIAFSKSGNLIYYVKAEVDKDDVTDLVLYVVPVSGGEPRRIRSNVGPELSLSPDNEKLVFVRESSEKRITEVVVTDTQPTRGEKILANRVYPEIIISIAWSPDGKTVACSVMNEREMYLAVLDAEKGNEIWRSDHRWKVIQNIKWLPDNSGIAVVAEKKGSPSDYLRVWFVSYPGGVVRRITNDLSNYYNSSFTLDADTLATVREPKAHSQLWRLSTPPTNAADHAIKLSDKDVDYFRPTWTRDGKIFFISYESLRAGIWRMDADGGNKKELLWDRTLKGPFVSLDGKFIVFSLEREEVRRIWRASADGTDIVKLTGGESGPNKGVHFDFDPIITPDGKWVIYTSQMGEKNTLWKVPIDGGKPVLLVDNNNYVYAPTVSPDGNYLAYFNQLPIKNNVGDWQIVVTKAAGGPPIHAFNVELAVNVTGGLHWTPDGRALTYGKQINGVSNIWRQPIDGGAPVQVTKFNDGGILDFSWSRDGKFLICSRAFPYTEALLLKDVK